MYVIPPVQTRHPNLYKNTVLPFKNDENSQQLVQVSSDYIDTLEENTRNAKNASILAAIGSVTTLIVSAVMLKKASEAFEVVKAAKPMIEELKEPAEAFKNVVSNSQKIYKRFKSSTIAKIFTQTSSEVTSNVLDAWKKATPIMEKLNTEKDPKKLAELNKQLSDIIQNTVIKIAENVDKKQAKNVDKLLDTPLIKVLESILGGKVNLSSKNSTEIMSKLAEIFKEGNISKSSTVREVIKPITEFVAKDDMMKKAVLLDRIKIVLGNDSEKLADLEKILKENSFKESLLKIKQVLGISEEEFQKAFKIK